MIFFFALGRNREVIYGVWPPGLPKFYGRQNLRGTWAMKLVSPQTSQIPAEPSTVLSCSVLPKRFHAGEEEAT